MSEIDLDALEQNARAATPGPWVIGDWAITANDEGGETICELNVHPSANAANHEMIAMLSPDVVLALVARLRAAEANVAEQDQCIAGCGEANAELQERAEAAESRAQRAEAQRDRLAEALRRITTGEPTDPGAVWRQDVARAALAEVDDASPPGVVGGGG